MNAGLTGDERWQDVLNLKLLAARFLLLVVAELFFFG